MKPLLVGTLFFVFIHSTSAALPAEQILAVVNDRIIFMTDLIRHHQLFEEDPSPEDQDLKGQLERFIDRVLLRMEAEKFVSHPPTEGEINRALDQIQKRLKGEDALNKVLKQLGLSRKELLDLIVEDLWVKKLIDERIEAFIVILPKDVEQYHQEHPKTFSGRQKEQTQTAIHKILYQKKKSSKEREYLLRLRARAQIRTNL